MDQQLTTDLWRKLAGPAPLVEQVSFYGRSAGLPSRFRVDVLANATIDGFQPRWAFPAGPTGQHEARWQ